ncbi:CXXC-type zinc finger protein 1-like isoform X2 [Bacillus rossius redtenbacheri]|uniref:CXXC-type zinc finger protein 1-like isoform X2 n=1 Tax=Bacillus rossius redtenbacheri TaxID=93214 RepID=UPI002FDE07CD
MHKEEIARQFMLPERKSKIATLLKQDGQAYCICRSSDSSRFMIGCDNCEEWYHGDCINITEKKAKYIKQYFCMRCQEEDPTLETKFKPQRRKGDSGCEEGKKKKDANCYSPAKHKPSSTAEDRRGKKRKYLLDASNACRSCPGCLRAVDCGTCANCRRRVSHLSSGKCVERQCVRTTKGASHRRRKDSSSDGEHGGGRAPGEAPRQCYGPACTKAARHASKYCSDDCGMKLAASRIYQVLPQRIHEWSLSTSVAEEGNKKSLESVRKQQLAVRKTLQELDKRQKELDDFITGAKTATIDSHCEDESEDEPEMSMYCITCGIEVNSRLFIKHIEKCFCKYESQSSFGSIYKTRIEGNNMFCDYYNPMNRTYCKRLRVLCPEHCKEAKVSPTEVCGCPLVTNVFDLTGEFCRAAKKTCLRHYCWEKLHRAQIDMERVRQWLKLDELVEQERQIRHLMASRAGVLALMLHSTYDHELMEQGREAIEKLQRQYQA